MNMLFSIDHAVNCLFNKKPSDFLNTERVSAFEPTNPIWILINKFVVVTQKGLFVVVLHPSNI